MQHGEPYTTLDDLIVTALNGGRYNRRRFGLETSRYTLKLVRARAADLPPDIQDEVCNEAIARLFEAGPAALLDRTGKAAFRLAVLGAIRSVRASYSPAGQRTRKGGPDAGRADPHLIVGVSQAKCANEATDTSGETVVDPQAAKAFEVVHARLDIETALASLSPSIGAALCLVHVRELPVTEVAAQAGEDRFSLRRRIKAAVSHLHLAA